MLDAAKQRVIRERMDVPGFEDIVIASVGAAIVELEAHLRGETVKTVIKYGSGIHETGPTALGGPPDVMREQARVMGYTGDICNTCGHSAMVRNGTCLRCLICGSTSGCS